MDGMDLLKQRALKSFLPMLMPMLDNLQEPVLNFIADLKNKHELLTLEAEIVAIIREKDGKINLIIAALDTTNRISRLIESYTFEQILELVKNQMK